MGCFEMPPNEASLEASIVLDQTIGASPATVTATAKTSGTDLTGLVYDWTVTHTTPAGSTVKEYEGQTDEYLVLEGLEPGSYAIAVKVTNASGDKAESTCENTFAAKPAVCYVSTSGSATWPYDEPAKAAKILADALANAAARVEILAGEYDAAEMGTMTDASFGTFLGVVDAAVEVRGAGTGATVIDFGNAGAGFLVKNAGARVDGLTLLNAASTAAAFNGAAFRVNAGVVSNVVVSGGAIWGSSVYVNSGALFTSSVVTNLTRCSGKDSAYPVAVSGGTVEDTVIAGNRVYENGGIRWLTEKISLLVCGPKTCELGVFLLVSAVNLFTANNTVAIVIAGPIAKECSDKFKANPVRIASVLDTASCVVQGLIPYGAQILIAIGVAKGLDMTIDTFSLIKCLYYQPLLAVAVFVAMALKRRG